MNSQKNLMWNWIMGKGHVNTNQIREFGHNNFIASPDKRVRELYAEGKIQRRWITETEKQALGLNKDVMIYHLPEEKVNNIL